jgi:kynureninase
MYEGNRQFALAQDAADPLAGFREKFLVPTAHQGQPVIYFCTNSLGLQPCSVRAIMEHDLGNWAQLGVNGHFKGETPWYSYQELLRQPHADLVGAQPDEVILMNGLTVNLHLMLSTFYQPQAGRTRILLDAPTFPSDLYAMQSHLRLRGRDPKEDLVCLSGAGEEESPTDDEVCAYLERHGSSIALVVWNAVNFLTGRAFDLERLTRTAHQQGCLVGLDLAHAAGNVPVYLHKWNVDFAVWCTYKYLCGGPGAVAGCFVHAKHGNNIDLARLAGWWGNDPARRFQMQLQPEFQPKPGADGWQISNPPILALAPLRAALPIFADATMDRICDKSIALTGYLEYLLERLPAGRFKIMTPRDPAKRGCQLSLAFQGDAEGMLSKLHDHGVVADFRKPNVLRIAPAPLYNTFDEVFRFAAILEELVR